MWSDIARSVSGCTEMIGNTVAEPPRTRTGFLNSYDVVVSLPAHGVMQSSMITEHALLPVIAGMEDEFETALAEATPIIAAARGFRRLTVSRGVETPSTYLLMVEWETLEDHTEGFRGSPAYEQWRAMLHHFYDPFPLVEHFQVVTTA